MKLVQAGLGEFGFSWLKDILLPYEGIQVIGLVDKNRGALEKTKGLTGLETVKFYENLEEALSCCKPDFVMNITPPAQHKAVDLVSLGNGIPVLSEKPIAETYDDALEIAATASKTGIPVMIAENYRFSGLSRKVKELLSSESIGPLSSIQVDFHRRHVTGNYHMALKHPLLLDVTVHHLDMIRYFSGAEVKSVHARSWTPEWSWYKGFSNLDLFLDMERDIKVSYRGSLSSYRNETDWLGDWRIEGRDGIITVTNGEIRLVNDHNDTIIKAEQEADSRKLLLDNFIKSLKHGLPGETDITDNIKTFEIVQAAMNYIEKHQIHNSGEVK